MKQQCLSRKVGAFSDLSHLPVLAALVPCSHPLLTLVQENEWGRRLWLLPPQALSSLCLSLCKTHLPQGDWSYSAGTDTLAAQTSGGKEKEGNHITQEGSGLQARDPTLPVIICLIW